MKREARTRTCGSARGSSGSTSSLACEPTECAVSTATSQLQARACPGDLRTLVGSSRRSRARLVPRPAWRQLHEPDVLVTLAVAASVRGGLVQSAQAVALSLSPHSRGPSRSAARNETRTRWPVRSLRRKRRAPGGLADRTLLRRPKSASSTRPHCSPSVAYAYPGLQLQGLQSRPEQDEVLVGCDRLLVRRSRRARTARRSLEPIWNRPEVLAVLAPVVEWRDSHQETLSA